MNDKLYQSWFQDTKLRASEKHQGNPIIDGKMVLGLKAGPSVAPINLLHEMAHLVEIDDKRCTEPGWGLNVPRVYIMGESCINPQTFQAAAREIRTSGIQRVLAHHVGISFDDFYGAKLIWDWIPGSSFCNQAFPELPSWEIEIDYKKRVTIICDRIAQAIMDESNKWTIESIHEEWIRKCQVHEERYTL